MDASAVRQALGSNKVIVMSASCTVSYSGRAESFLGEGDRIIIIKSDKTLLIHQPCGGVPINYMRDNTSIKVAEDGQRLVLDCRNEKECMTIIISRLHFFHSQEMQDSQKLQLVGSEKDMSVMIYNNPSLIEAGFTPLSMEEHTRFGFIDVFGYDRNNVLVVVECKRYSADHKAVEQLRRYAEKVKQTKGLSVIRGIVAAPKISPSAAELIAQFGYEFRSIIPPRYMEKYDSSQRRLDL